MDKGKMQTYVETLLWGIIGFILLSTAYGWVRNYPGYDATDDVANRERSGMILHTDYGTGCQYIVSAGLFARSMVPRVDRNGRHVCN